MKTVDLVYFDAGGGHRAAALALQALAQAQQRPFQTRLVNLTRVLDPQASFRRLAGFEPEDYYNARLRRGWTLGLAQELKLLQAMIRLAHRPLVRQLAAHWRASPPDAVVSLVPNFVRALHDGLRRARPHAPFATVMTDLADHPPHFWIEPGLDQRLVCGTAHARAQALAAGLPPERVHLVSGMILRPAVDAARGIDRAEARAALGLQTDQPVGVVMFGGHGSTQMLHIARRLPQVPLIFACGHNAGLLGDLKALRRPAPHVAVGFTPEVGRLLRAADFFIGKPGPGSLSEAVHLGLPVITFDNAWTMPQERYNATWVRDHGLGRVVRGLRELPGAVAGLTAELDAARARVAAVHNRAAFEVLDIVADMLEPAAPHTAAADGGDAVPEGAAPSGLRARTLSAAR